MRRLFLLALLTSLTFTNASAGGVSLGGNMPTKLVSGADQRLVLVGSFKAVRWVPQTGRSVQRPMAGALGPSVALQAPAGEWAELVLIFDGPVSVSDGARVRALSVTELAVPFEVPLRATGDTVTVSLDLAVPLALWTAGDVSELEAAIVDGALAR